MIDWPKVVRDLEKQNARLKQDIKDYIACNEHFMKENIELEKRLEQTTMALNELIEINKYLEKKDGTPT